MMPPTTGPKIGPHDIGSMMVDMTPPTATMPRLCAISTGRVVMSVMIMPAANPSTALEQTSRGRVGDTAQRTEPARNSHKPAIQPKRPPRVCSVHPATGTPTASASRYTVETHWI